MKTNLAVKPTTLSVAIVLLSVMVSPGMQADHTVDPTGEIQGDGGCFLVTACTATIVGEVAGCADVSFVVALFVNPCIDSGGAAASAFLASYASHELQPPSLSGFHWEDAFALAEAGGESAWNGCNLDTPGPAVCTAAKVGTNPSAEACARHARVASEGIGRCDRVDLSLLSSRTTYTINSPPATAECTPVTAEQWAEYGDEIVDALAGHFLPIAFPEVMELAPTHPAFMTANAAIESFIIEAQQTITLCS